MCFFIWAKSNNFLYSNFSMLEIPRCRSQQNHKRFMTSTSNLFTRIDNFGTSREIKTSKANRAARAFPHLTKNQSLDNSKENMDYASFLSKVKSATNIDEKKNVSKYLFALRKQYDKMAKNIKAKQFQINTMNKDIRFLRQKSKGHTFLFSDMKQRVKSKQEELDQMILKQDTARMETKVLENIIRRMKHDQLKNKLTNKGKQLEVKEKLREVKSKEDEILQWDEAIHKTVEKASQIKKQFLKNMEERLGKLHDFESRVEELQEHEKFEMQRKERTYQLLSMESNDIMDAKNVVLRDVLMANKLLDKVLEGKINDLLARYEKVQNNYHIIRNQTNIADPPEMTRKFFSYNQALEELTSTITYYEKRQEELIKRNQELKSIEKQKINKMLEDQKNLNLEKKQFESVKEQLVKETLEKQLAFKQISSWNLKYLKGFGINDTGDSIAQMENLCSYLLQEVQRLNGKSLSDKKFESSGVRFKKVVKELSIQDQKIRRSEAQEVNQSNIRESRYLAIERSKVKNHFLIKTQIPRMKNL